MRLLALSLMVLGAVDETSLSAIERGLTPFTTLHAHFLQKKSISGFSKPLLSEGEIDLTKGQGIYWHTEKPFDSGLRITPQGVEELHGGQARPLASGQGAGAREVGTLLFSLVAMDLEGLKGRFELVGASRQPTGSFQVALRPRDASVRKVVDEVVLQGKSTLERVTLREGNGDQTDILFTQMQLDRQAPGAPASPALENGRGDAGKAGP
jgi:hypothetical protein